MISTNFEVTAKQSAPNFILFLPGPCYIPNIKLQWKSVECFLHYPAGKQAETGQNKNILGGG